MKSHSKFLFVTTFYPPYNFGGDGIFVYRLAHALGDLGHQVDVVHCIDSYYLQTKKEPDNSFAQHPNVTVHGLRSKFGALSPLLTQQTGFPFLKYKKIDEITRQNNFDVIHFHNISLLGPALFKLKVEKAVKLYTAHEYWLVCPTHILWKFNERLCERPECFRCTIAAKRPPQLWRYTPFLNRVSEHIDQFLAPSRAAADLHHTRGFKRDFESLRAFVPDADDDWRYPGVSPNLRPFFLFVGRLEKIKGLPTLISAIRQLPNVDLLVVGDGEEQERLQTMAMDNLQVKFLGRLAQEDLGKFYVHCLACVIPSLVYETGPIVALEAFARKAPVIGHDRGGLSELLAESKGGLVYRDDGELIEHMKSVAGSSELRNDLGKNGYQAFREKWSKEVHLEHYLQIIDRVAAKKFGTSWLV